MTDGGGAVRDFYKLELDLMDEIDARTGHTKRRHLDKILVFIQCVDQKSKEETLARIGNAVDLLLEQFESVRDAGSSFAEFKTVLRPDQAEKIANKTIQIGRVVREQASELSNEPHKPTLEEIGFILVAASLYAKSGADWIGPDEERFIDNLIRLAMLSRRYEQPR